MHTARPGQIDLHNRPEWQPFVPQLWPPRPKGFRPTGLLSCSITGLFGRFWPPKEPLRDQQRPQYGPNSVTHSLLTPLRPWYSYEALRHSPSGPGRPPRAHVGMTSYMYKKQQKMQNLSHVPVTGPSSHPKGPLARLGSGHGLLGHRPSLCPSERPLSSPSERCGSDPRSVWQVKRVVSRLVGRIESFPVGDTRPEAEYFEPPRQEKGFNFFHFFSFVL